MCTQRGKAGVDIASEVVVVLLPEIAPVTAINGANDFAVDLDGDGHDARGDGWGGKGDAGHVRGSVCVVGRSAYISFYHRNRRK